MFYVYTALNTNFTIIMHTPTSNKKQTTVPYIKSKFSTTFINLQPYFVFIFSAPSISILNIEIVYFQTINNIHFNNQILHTSPNIVKLLTFHPPFPTIPYKQAIFTPSSQICSSPINPTQTFPKPLIFKQKLELPIKSTIFFLNLHNSMPSKSRITL